LIKNEIDIFSYNNIYCENKGVVFNHVILAQKKKY